MSEPAIASVSPPAAAGSRRRGPVPGPCRRPLARPPGLEPARCRDIVDLNEERQMVARSLGSECEMAWRFTAKDARAEFEMAGLDIAPDSGSGDRRLGSFLDGLPATKPAAGEHDDIQLCESKEYGPPRLGGISLQTHSIIRSILAGIPSSGYSARAQIPSKHKVGGSNPSRGATHRFLIRLRIMQLHDGMQRVALGLATAYESTKTCRLHREVQTPVAGDWPGSRWPQLVQVSTCLLAESGSGYSVPRPYGCT
jgi:hypothetical protein